MRQGGINYIIRSGANEERHDKKCRENCQVLAAGQGMALGEGNFQKNWAPPQDRFQADRRAFDHVHRGAKYGAF